MRRYTLIPINSDPATQPSMAPYRHDPIYAYLDLYRLRLPFGLLSSNEAFWEKVDERALPDGVHDGLLKNGIRTGTASVDQWSYFKHLIDQYPVQTQKSTLTGGEGKGIEMAVKTDVQTQTLFYFDRKGRLHGRTYGPCDDVLAIHFGPSMQAFGYVRIALSPIIRATRKRLEYTALNNEEQVEYTAPQELYDIGMSIDLPPGRFLIIAPSPQAQYPSRLGHVFLTKNAPAEQYEQIFIIVPHVFRAVEQELSRK